MQTGQLKEKNLTGMDFWIDFPTVTEKENNCTTSNKYICKSCKTFGSNQNGLLRQIENSLMQNRRWVSLSKKMTHK